MPILEEYESSCDAQTDQVVDESPIAKAIRYSRNHRAALRRFLDDGRLPIHNSWSERELRREVVGRSNWLFVGSNEDGEVNATFVSLLASARLHKVAPLAYLRDLLCLLPWLAGLRHEGPPRWGHCLGRRISCPERPSSCLPVTPSA